VRHWDDGKRARNFDSGERRLDLALAAPACGRERDDVVPTGLGEAEQRPADVVADAGARVGQRRDVDDDPQRVTASGRN
jgi:hypothetical protein